ncbi:ferric reductase like transmembrane component-domain-containing protein [Usnea florida]
MGFPYHFVSLTDEQNSHRRQLLDGYGQFAQLSVLLLPLVYQICLGTRLLISRIWPFKPSQAVKEHQSPVVSRFKQPATGYSTNVLARVRWFLDEEVREGWNTRQEWLITGLWAIWLLVLVFRDTGDDYLHLTKRFGIVAASQLPLHYLLAAKSWSPIQYLTRMSHEELNPYHRLLGRLLIAFFSIHAMMYLNFYIQLNLLSKRIQDRDVILGLTAIITFITIGTTALAKVRTWNYRVFFYLHVILSLSLLPILYFHVSHLRLYIIESVAIYLVLILQRNVSQTTTSANIKPISSANLLAISIPLTKALSSRSFTPGQHIYLGFPTLPQKLRINPFSIANSPYGAAKYFPDLATYDQVLFVAGGVGATFTLPLYLDLLRRKARGDYLPMLKFVWTVRRHVDAQWGSGSIELQERDQLLSDSSTPGESTLQAAKTMYKGRPYFGAIIDEAFSYDGRERVAVLVCGPRGMGASVRREVTRWVWKGRDVFWHSEEFGW